MAESRGKLFEREFRRGLLLLPGMDIRLFDGMSYAKQRQPGDFIYASHRGMTFLIECKSTQQNSFPYANIRDHQLEDLLAWQQGCNGTRLGLVAVEFWKHRRSFVMLAYELRREIEEGGRKSLTLDRAEEIGLEIRRVKADGGFAYDLGILEE